jgi:hypothetical protein
MQIPESEHGGLHPELAARCTAAEAAMADFDREEEAYRTELTTPMPDWHSWSYRFRGELGGLVKILRTAA